MEIISYGCYPNIKISVYSESYSELRQSLFDLDASIKQKRYLTVSDVFKKFGHIAQTSQYSTHMGWYADQCFGNGPIGEKKRIENDKKVFYYNFPDPIDFLKDEPVVHHTIVYHTNAPAPGSNCKIQLKFKPALTKAAKDDKIQKAYNVLTKEYCRKEGTDEDLVYAVEEAIGYLGEVLE